MNTAEAEFTMHLSLNVFAECSFTYDKANSSKILLTFRLALLGLETSAGKVHNSKFNLKSSCLYHKFAAMDIINVESFVDRRTYCNLRSNANLLKICSLSIHADDMKALIDRDICTVHNF